MALPLIGFGAADIQIDNYQTIWAQKAVPIVPVSPQVDGTLQTDHSWWWTLIAWL